MKFIHPVFCRNGIILPSKRPHFDIAAHQGQRRIGIGFLAGILCFSRVLKRLLARHHTPTMAFLTGLMAGSLRKVWPFRLPIEGDLDHYLCVMPDNYDSETWLTIGLVVIAFGVVMVIERFAAKVSDDSSQR